MKIKHFLRWAGWSHEAFVFVVVLIHCTQQRMACADVHDSPKTTQSGHGPMATHAVPERLPFSRAVAFAVDELVVAFCPFFVDVVTKSSTATDSWTKACTHTHKIGAQPERVLASKGRT